MYIYSLCVYVYIVCSTCCGSAEALFCTFLADGRGGARARDLSAALCTPSPTPVCGGGGALKIRGALLCWGAGGRPAGAAERAEESKRTNCQSTALHSTQVSRTGPRHNVVRQHTDDNTTRPVPRTAPRSSDQRPPSSSLSVSHLLLLGGLCLLLACKPPRLPVGPGRRGQRLVDIVRVLALGNPPCALTHRLRIEEKS